jgi:hypothetical protein
LLLYYWEQVLTLGRKELSRMNTTLCALSLATLLAAGSVTPAAAHPLPHGAAAGRGIPEATMTPPYAQDRFVIAIIRGIDHQRGLLELDSELGLMQARVDPGDIKDLHVGDKLLVRVVAEDPAPPLLPDPTTT